MDTTTKKKLERAGWVLSTLALAVVVVAGVFMMSPTDKQQFLKRLQHIVNPGPEKPLTPAEKRLAESQKEVQELTDQAERYCNDPELLQNPAFARKCGESNSAPSFITFTGGDNVRPGPRLQGAGDGAAETPPVSQAPRRTPLPVQRDWCADTELLKHSKPMAQACQARGGRRP